MLNILHSSGQSSLSDKDYEDELQESWSLIRIVKNDFFSLNPAPDIIVFPVFSPECR